MIRLLVWMVFALMPLAGLALAGEPEQGCTLSPGAYSDRMSEIEVLFADSSETRELEDGYEFRFPGDSEWSDKLLELIHAERHCCQFLKFELSFEPYDGPIWFRVRGSAQAKVFLESLME